MSWNETKASDREGDWLCLRIIFVWHFLCNSERIIKVGNAVSVISVFKYIAA